MPTTDRPDGPDGSEDLFEVAEATGLAADTRETVPVERARRYHETVPLDVANHETRQVDVRTAMADRPTVRIDPRGDNRETVLVPGQRRPADRSGRAPLVLAAGFATLWAALLSYLPVAAVIGLARTLEGSGGLGGAASAGLAGWLLGHGVPLGTSLGPLGLAPLLLTLLIVWRLNRAGLHVTRAIGARRSGSARDALLVAAAVGLWYSVFGALAALLIDGPGHTVTTSRAATNFLVVGVAGALIGSVRSTDTLVALARRLPPVLRNEPIRAPATPMTRKCTAARDVATV